MLGFERFETAAITITRIELVYMMRKQQFKTRNLPGRPIAAPDVWDAVLAVCPCKSFSYWPATFWEGLQQNQNELVRIALFLFPKILGLPRK